MAICRFTAMTVAIKLGFTVSFFNIYAYYYTPGPVGRRHYKMMRV